MCVRSCDVIMAVCDDVTAAADSWSAGLEVHLSHVGGRLGGEVFPRQLAGGVGDGRGSPTRLLGRELADHLLDLIQTAAQQVLGSRGVTPSAGGDEQSH